jgi:dienelactone hydrolase
MRLLSLSGLVLTVAVGFSQDDPSRLYPDKAPADPRSKPKDLNGYFPFTPPATKDGWNNRVQRVRTQLLVANGLWPMPEKTPLNPVIHGKIECDGYTVEKVYFASMPGHYVCGNLYRPTKDANGKRPGVLAPHGHWANGRFYENSEANARKEIASGAEKTMEGARYLLQAGCAQLARMGIVVFHYDMVGNADSKALPHAGGFADAEAELRSQSAMGLQTWNSIRALDFITSLPDVDASRIGMTGGSGGGTQTFILGAIDDRLAAAFPAVMVSTAMQGGCVCENCSYLRVGTGNVEFAGMFAPRPLAMTGANDWTKDIMTKGYPELRKLYALHGAEDKVLAKAWLEFGHNYNQVAREMMYAWFNKHLLGGSGDIAEQPFKPVPPKELSVFDSGHPRPKDELNASRLREAMTAAADKQMKALEPKNAKSLGEYRRVVGEALKVMIGEDLIQATPIDVQAKPKEVKLDDGVVVHLAPLGRKGEPGVVPMVGMFGKAFKGDKVVVWVHPAGKASLFEGGKVVPAAKALIEKGYAIAAPDVFETGEMKPEKPFPVDGKFAGYTYGYNRPVFANRVRDILTAVLFAKDVLKAKTIHLVGWEGAGPWVVAARAVCGDRIARTAADLNQFKFEGITSVSDENLLPGAVKFGGLPAFLALCAPGEVFAHNHSGTGTGQLSKSVYEVAGAKDALKRESGKAKAEDVVEWLTK